MREIDMNMSWVDPEEEWQPVAGFTPMEMSRMGCLGRLVHPCGRASVRADGSVRHRAV